MPEDYFDRLNLAKVLARAYEAGTQVDELQGPPINPANEMSRRLMDSPVGEKAKTFASALYDAAKLPGDLYSGKHRSYLGLRREDYTDDPNAPDPNERLTQGAVSLSDVMSMGGMPMATKGAAGIFGGRLAVTADHQALNRAEALAKAGTSREKIWNETGWFQGADGKWRFEISDRNSKFTPGEHNQRSFLGEVLDHPELYAAYPGLADIATKYKSASRTGSYWEPTKATRKAEERMQVPTQDFVFPDSARGTALHEAQHAIQYREGFATGGNPQEIIPLAIKEIQKNPALSGKERELAHEAYRRLAGEVEARNVDARKTFFRRTEADIVPPWSTEDIVRNKQTVRGVRD